MNADEAAKRIIEVFVKGYAVSLDENKPTYVDILSQDIELVARGYIREKEKNRIAVEALTYYAMECHGARNFQIDKESVAGEALSKIQDLAEAEMTDE